MFRRRQPKRRKDRSCALLVRDLVFVLRVMCYRHESDLLLRGFFIYRAMRKLDVQIRAGYRVLLARDN